MCNDCTVIYYEGDFKKRLIEQEKLENEMIKTFGINKRNDFRYRIYYDDNIVYAEHITKDQLEKIKEKEKYFH